jgi:hypothetical protein
MRQVPLVHTCNPSFSGRSRFKASWGKQFERPYLEKPFTKIGLVEWLKVKALSSSPSTPPPPKKSHF